MPERDILKAARLELEPEYARDDRRLRVRQWTGAALVSIAAGLIAATVASYPHHSYLGSDLPIMRFLTRDPLSFAILFTAAAVAGFAVGWWLFGLKPSERTHALLSGGAGLFIAYLTSFGPGRRGFAYWLYHGNAVRLLAGVAAALILFEIWRRRQPHRS